MNFKFLIIIIGLTAFLNAQEDLTRWVDPFIGTGGHGHTFPGATTPFGMVQLSPDTDIQGWDWCSGYHASDSNLMGFSHTHLSGTGGSDYGDIMLLPFTGEEKLVPGPKEDPDRGYRSRFSRETEKASPGYYAVTLDDYEVKAELTVTPRVGFHRYHYPEKEQQKLLLDLKHGISDKTTASRITVRGKQEITGLRRSKGWAADQHVYYAMQFSRPFTEVKLYKDDQMQSTKEEINGENCKAVFIFDASGEPLKVKVALSSVDADGALKNLNGELGHWDFDRVREAARATWNAHLQKIEINGGTDEQKTVFYTALYHTMMHPNVFNDVDGRYRGMDNVIHTVEKGDHYTLFSLWDTFRATHPLYNLLFPEKNMAFIRSMLAKYREHGLLPVWELWSNETGTMIGYHSVPVIVDAYVKGHREFDVDLAFEAMKKSAMQDHLGLREYRNLEFIPLDREGNSVSKTLEYAYDDWCIAVMARELGQEEDYRTFIHRAQHYQNQFDHETGMMRGRYANGLWREDFSPVTYSALGAGDFTEGNSWQYSWSVQQDIAGLIRLMGGDDGFEKTLDRLFTADYDVSHRPSDVTGLIGEYAHGNEPSHHVAYLYIYVGKPAKTQQMIRRILNEQYSAERDGLSGNEDCGQMSAWYIFSAMGFYPVTPGLNDYVIGSPLFEKVTLHLPNGKQFTIKAEGNSSDAAFIRHVKLNGKTYTKSFVRFEDIMDGGDLVFDMTADADGLDWATSVEDRPVSEIMERVGSVDERKVFQPYFSSGGTAQLFRKSKTVEMKCITGDAEIYYTTDQSEPSREAKRYTVPITITKSTTFRLKAYKEGLQASEPLAGHFRKAFSISEHSEYPKITLEHAPHRRYEADGAESLLDGRFGMDRFGEGNWLGFQKDDMVATIDLGDLYTVEHITARFLRTIGSWIFLPVSVKFQVAGTDQDFQTLAVNKPGGNEPDLPVKIFDISQAGGKEKVRYIKIVAENIGVCPPWHMGKGGPAFLFCDEIIVETEE